MASRRPAGALTRRDFFGDLIEVVRRDLPEDRREIELRQTMNLLKLHYGANYRVHYEVWISSEQQQVEVGLHFEDGPASTERLLSYFDTTILEIKHELGVQADLERWTRSWGHLFEIHPLEPLTADFAERLAERIVRYITVLQPMLDDAYERGLVPRTPHPSTFHQRFHKRSRNG